jgi:hypothetical protein
LIVSYGKFQNPNKFQIPKEENLTGFAGASQFNLPLPVYLAGKGDWRAKGIHLAPNLCLLRDKPAGGLKCNFLCD